ncbi:MAG TPA: 4-hydroxy-tetrahydrodipicolinate reductase [Caulobacteraceae bacterium]
MVVGVPIRVGIAGGLGEMGAVVAQLVVDSQGVTLGGSFDRDDAAGLGRTLAGCDVIIDFSTAAASCELAMRAAAAGGPALVIGSTGFSSEQENTLGRAALSLAMVKSGNFSLGANILAGIVEETARRLGRADWDIEIFEAHHRRKRDAPSGTALMLGEAAARGRGARLADLRGPPREGADPPRRQGDIGFSSLRGGGIVGEHAVVFASDDEILTLSHSARNRRLFARGALEAALWIVGRPTGLYTMADVLGFRDAPTEN